MAPARKTSVRAGKSTVNYASSSWIFIWLAKLTRGRDLNQIWIWGCLFDYGDLHVGCLLFGGRVRLGWSQRAPLPNVTAGLDEWSLVYFRRYTWPAEPSGASVINFRSYQNKPRMYNKCHLKMQWIITHCALLLSNTANAANPQESRTKISKLPCAV